MSRIGNRVLLGYEDEPITDKHKDIVDFTTNKIGGKPDWPGDAPTAVTCKLCGLNLPLVLQIYAPLDFTSFHRTLYIFACINPNCWNQNGSWVCLRSQTKANDVKSESKLPQHNDYCQNDWMGAGGDNWDDEENGNTIDIGDTTGEAVGIPLDITNDMRKLTVDERNANSCGSVEGAMGVLDTSATIEGDEGEVVCIDTPTAPQINLIAMLEEAVPMPQVPNSSLHFSPYFISVWEEEITSPSSPTASEHIRSLIGDYQSIQIDERSNGGGASGGMEENYEKALPAHGDKTFFQFISRIQANPGQLLRYGGYPLPLYPMHDRPKQCRHCGGELLFELQILPTLIPKLHLLGSETGAHLEFGSIFLFSCGASCWDQRDSYREESLVVQMEKM